MHANAQKDMILIAQKIIVRCTVEHARHSKDLLSEIQLNSKIAKTTISLFRNLTGIYMRHYFLMEKKTKKKY
jgi:hypothetical protein